MFLCKHVVRTTGRLRVIDKTFPQAAKSTVDTNVLLLAGLELEIKGPGDSTPGTLSTGLRQPFAWFYFIYTILLRHG